VTTSAPEATLPIPAQVSELTAQWFSQVLHTDVHAVEVLDARSGSTGGELPVRSPLVWHSAYEPDEGAFVMVLEDPWRLRVAGFPPRPTTTTSCTSPTPRWTNLRSCTPRTPTPPIEIARPAMIRTTEAIDDLDAVGLLEERHRDA
jgi:hypothetical protein